MGSTFWKWENQDRIWASALPSSLRRGLLLLRSPSSNALYFEPWAGPYIAMNAANDVRDFFLANFYPPAPFIWICFQNCFRAFSVLAVANTGSCVGSQNKIGHPARRDRQSMQVPVLSVRRKWIGSKPCFTVLFSGFAFRNCRYNSYFPRSVGVFYEIWSVLCCCFLWNIW